MIHEKNLKKKSRDTVPLNTPKKSHGHRKKFCGEKRKFRRRVLRTYRRLDCSQYETKTQPGPVPRSLKYHAAHTKYGKYGSAQPNVPSDTKTTMVLGKAVSVVQE
jgi:hypothetical protein